MLKIKITLLLMFHINKLYKQLNKFDMIYDIKFKIIKMILKFN